MADNPIEIQRYLKGVDYPVTKDDLISTRRGQRRARRGHRDSSRR
ncbi:MAG: hypothetical protein WKF31_04905 [Thermoleophilaceae bacterium]